VIECDTVIVAVGTRANPLSLVALPQAARTKRGYLEVDETGRTSVEGVWAGGDIVTGSATVILAMGAGKRAAVAMDAWMRTS
jgi:glutamate synthase (NADPH/NADH) small chain